MQKDFEKILESDGHLVHIQTKITLQQDYLLKIKAKQMGKKRHELFAMAIENLLQGGAA